MGRFNGVSGHVVGFKLKECSTCGKEYKPKSGAQKFCSMLCGGRRGVKDVEKQYEYISGNWRQYYQRLRNQKSRRKITVDEILDLHSRQDGKCALTGRSMTCILKRGEKCWTNASIDRLEAGGDYVAGNIQLVCADVNLWRSSQPLSHFREVCRMVASR